MSRHTDECISRRWRSRRQKLVRSSAADQHRLRCGLKAFGNMISSERRSERFPRSYVNSPRIVCSQLQLHRFVAREDRPRELTHQPSESAAAVAAGNSPKKKCLVTRTTIFLDAGGAAGDKSPERREKGGDKTGAPVVATSRESLSPRRRLVG